MSRFRKKTDYSYYSSYNSKKGKLRINRVVLASIAGIVLVIAIVAMLNLNRIKLMWKGYSWNETSEILSLTGSEEEQVLSYERLDHISEWISLSEEVEYYDDYEKYLAIKPKEDKEEIVKYIDTIFDKQVPKLTSMGYSDKDLWDMLKTATAEDLQYLIDNNYRAEDTKEYRKVKGYVLQNMAQYMETYKQTKDYTYSVVVTNYPFIISTNPVNAEYTITNPKDILTLVKKGFYLSSDYEPDDLVNAKTLPAQAAEDVQMRKEVADALDEMSTDAKKENYTLLVNSAYRSYQRQSDVYKEFETKFGGLYAAEYVATPGASEHQTGLGVDLTSQSVEDGKHLVFGDTPEYKWVVKNAHRYGFIMRFETGTADITGIAHEPWHLRYVGKEAAKEIYEKGITFEEYCLYNNIIPELTKK